MIDVKNTIRSLIKDRGYEQAEFAEMIGMKKQSLKNRLQRDSCSVSDFQIMLDALGYEIVIRDKKTGEDLEQL